MTVADLHEVSVELTRVVDRLDSLPLGRAATTTEACLETAALIVDRTRVLADDIPADAVLPDLGPQALGSLLAVVGRDYLDAVHTSPGTDVTEVLARLTALRRSLP